MLTPVSLYYVVKCKTSDELVKVMNLSKTLILWDYSYQCPLLLWYWVWYVSSSCISWGEISMLDKVLWGVGELPSLARCCMRISREYWIEVLDEGLCFSKGGQLRRLHCQDTLN